MPRERQKNEAVPKTAMHGRIDACWHGIYMPAHEPIVQDHPVKDQRRHAPPP
jgi:hypothetical protein